MKVILNLVISIKTLGGKVLINLDIINCIKICLVHTNGYHKLDLNILPQIWFPDKRIVINIITLLAGDNYVVLGRSINLKFSN